MNECVVIGNGESLRYIDPKIFDKTTFGSNCIGLLFYPQYYACVDSTLLRDNRPEVYEAARKAKRAFISTKNASLNWELPNIEWVDENSYPLSGERVFTGHTVTYYILKIALEMFDTILLVGVDHTTEWKHFSDQYPKYSKRPIDKMASQEYHYGLIADKYRKKGKRIINLSPPSALDKIFERGKVSDWIQKG